MKSAPIDSLPNELLRRIIDQILPDPERTVPIDDRAFLSVESFDKPLPSNALSDIRRFRRTCRKFAEVGEPLLFTFVGARFSKHGLRKLEQLSSWPHLTRHVKKFSYLVPYWYPNAKNLLSSATEYDNAALDLIQEFQRRAEEQKQMSESDEDIAVLKRAIGSFEKLQFVKLLRVADPADRNFKDYVQTHEGFEGFVDRYWTPACSRGSSALGRALLSTNAPSWSRFYLPVLSINSAEHLAPHISPSLSKLAARLTCLTLVFDDGDDLDERISNLSGAFRSMFAKAENMQAIHVGFPRHHPLNLPLEAVFHNVIWEKLVAFGIAGWSLNSDEILGLAFRHKERLKGLRLRDVQLKEGSMWKDVLGPLRNVMHRLEWVSLRRIGYMNHFEDVNGGGAEVPDDPMFEVSPSESDEDDDDRTGEGEQEPLAGPSSFNNHVNGHYGMEEDFDAHTNSDDEHGPEANDTEFPDLDSPDSPIFAPWLNGVERSYPGTAEDIGDNGHSVSYRQRKAWERWVVGKHPEYN